MTQVNQAVNDDTIKEDAGSMDNAQQLRIIEALIFASIEPVTIKDLQKHFDDAEGDVDFAGIIQTLQDDYAARGVNLVQRGDGAQRSYCFRTAIDLSDDLKLTRETPKKLSQAAQETLAVIAYHQPVTRPEIENIRGVAVSKGTLDLLMEEGWITIGRRKDVPGRPVTWKTTPAFLDYFGLDSLKSLPGFDELKASGLLDTRPAIDIVDPDRAQTSDLFDDNGDDDDADDKEIL